MISQLACGVKDVPLNVGIQPTRDCSGIMHDEVDLSRAKCFVETLDRELQVGQIGNVWDCWLTARSYCTAADIAGGRWTSYVSEDLYHSSRKLLLDQTDWSLHKTMISATDIGFHTVLDAN